MNDYNDYYDYLITTDENSTKLDVSFIETGEIICQLDTILGITVADLIQSVRIHREEEVEIDETEDTKAPE